MTLVRFVDDAPSVQALMHPVRVQVLDELREPDSAAGVARRIGKSRQSVNYHVKELAAAGLVEPAGERRSGNFVEQLFQSVAKTFIVTPRLAWKDPRRVAALRDQVPLEHLISLGERVQRDASALLDRAAFDGEQVASASLEAEVHFPDEATRAAFLQDYAKAVGPLLTKYGSQTGEPYRAVLAVYPDSQEEEPSNA